MITADRLRRILHYDPDTGVFTWLVNTCRMPAGSAAGTTNSCKGYVSIKIDGTLYKAHRLSWLYMTGAWPPDQVDHINGKRNDNRWANLREATASQNRMNTRRCAANTSGFKGVDWCKNAGKWRARIKINGKSQTLGLHDTPELAYASYVAKAGELFGEFARVA